MGFDLSIEHCAFWPDGARGETKHATVVTQLDTTYSTSIGYGRAPGGRESVGVHRLSYGLLRSQVSTRRACYRHGRLPGGAFAPLLPRLTSRRLILHRRSAVSVWSPGSADANGKGTFLAEKISGKKSTPFITPAHPERGRHPAAFQRAARRDSRLRRHHGRSPRCLEGGTGEARCVPARCLEGCLIGPRPVRTPRVAAGRAACQPRLPKSPLVAQRWSVDALPMDGGPARAPRQPPVWEVYRGPPLQRPARGGCGGGVPPNRCLYRYQRRHLGT